MKDDRSILLVLFGDTGRVHQFALPRSLLRAVRGVAITLLAAFVGGLLFAGAVVGVQWYREYRAQGEHDALVAELRAAGERIDDLEARVSRLVGRGDVLRVVAGLGPLDRELLQVGVGGPRLPSPEEHPLSSIAPELGEAAFVAQYGLRALDRRIRLLEESFAQVADSVEMHRERLLSTPSILPTPGRVSSGFANARLHPIYEEPLPHTGIDISAPRGTPIRAAARGRVVTVERRAGYGLLVELDHGFGYRTLYGHIRRPYVEEGDTVERGDLIASVGSTGIATGPHLHYEVRFEGQPQNPMNYVLPGSLP